ncbi:MAG TPA: substrate-binding domain-containing protein, partial [Candidatus Nitrosocosmicus sp.]|nr:substrate-binding domain-containing protein [Candidatus Nitrosocosmicus sp.]
RDENAVNRDKGLKKAAQEMGATIVQDVPSEWNPDKALSGLSAALQAHPDATGIFVASDFLMPAIQSALERAKKWAPYGEKGHIYLGSQDVFPSGAKLLKEKIIDVNTAFDIWPMSTSAIDTIIKLVEKKPIENKDILIKGRLFDQNNINTETNVWANDYKE